MIRGVRIARPETLKEALQVRADLGAKGRLIAGGTDLIVELRKKPPAALTLIDLTRIQELKGIREESGGLWIGALTTHADISSCSLVAEHATALGQACGEVGSVQIRNRGTIGGNVANASPSADGLTALVALGAEAEVVSVRGVRRLLVEELVEGPYKVGLGDDEIIRGFYVPSQGSARTAFLKLGRREALAIARINVACLVQLEGCLIKRCMIAVGSVMPKTQRVKEAENAILGSQADKETALRAGEIVADRMVAVSGVRWSTPYKEPAVKIMVARVLMKALGITDV